MKKGIKGMTTAEVMVMMVAISLVIMAAYEGSFSAFKTYGELIHRERAMLYAAETLEQFEAMKLTRVQQNYMNRWENFLGNKEDGQYRLLQADNISEMNLLKISGDYGLDDEDTGMFRIYEEDEDGFYSRLERRIFVEDKSEEGLERKLVTVSVYWGLAGNYEEEGGQQVRLQTIFAK